MMPVRDENGESMTDVDLLDEMMTLLVYPKLENLS
jgi:hypothetical protein